jgi:hypothetical protein
MRAFLEGIPDLASRKMKNIRKKSQVTDLKIDNNVNFFPPPAQKCSNMLNF